MIVPLRFLQGLLLTSFLVQGLDEEDANLQKCLDDMKELIEETGGFFHQDIEIRYFRLHEETPPAVNTDSIGSDDVDFPIYNFGLFVKPGATIPAGEVLFEFTEDAFFHLTEKYDIARENIPLLAKSIQNVRKEHEDESVEYDSPYMKFLLHYVLDVQVRPTAMWTQEGKELLGSFLDDDFVTTDIFLRFIYDFSLDDYKRQQKDNFRRRAENIQLAVSRVRDQIVCPVYDLISHSNNPEKINVKKRNEIYNHYFDGESQLFNVTAFGVQATKDLQGGDELFHSYGLGRAEYLPDYGYIEYGVGTAEIFRDFGFVEDYPQRWHFDDLGLDFSLRVVNGTKDEKGERELELVPLVSKHIDDDAVYYLKHELKRLRSAEDEIHAWEIDTTGTNDLYDGIAPEELKVAKAFISAYTTVLEIIVERSDTCPEGDECEYIVEEAMTTIDNTDSRYFTIYQCETLAHNLLEEDFGILESIKSAYQSISYYKDLKTDDICLYLDGVYQMCNSYWPHYHELVVHKTAKYLLEPVRRVLWVGGGDSGVLNEFLKYPSLELAVGLELDQQVTRTAFKHFKSRPHYDNPKVQWWYGDASKSLLMLPEEYFGTFDMVVVDLSDTVFSLSVSSELAVMEALSLLLRPGGIFEMNELFFKKVSDIFEYTIHYLFTDVPKICDQAAIIASNDIDFLKKPLTDHVIDQSSRILVENDSMKTKHQFDRVHDFRRNPNPVSKKLCKQAEDEMNIKKVQETAPGIMMIVEAENLKVDLTSPEAIRKLIVDALEDLGMHVILGNMSSSSSRFVIMLKEGYLSVRLFSEVKYCSLDIHLWSAFERHDKIKEAVVKVLGGDLLNGLTTSYRIVVGGMFGLPTWRKDSETHGPKITKSCPNVVEAKRNQRSDEKVLKQALEMGFDVIQGENLTVAVLCNQSNTACITDEIVRSHEKVHNAVIFTACENENDCSIDIAVVNAAFPEGLDVIIIDWDSPSSMGDIALTNILFSDAVNDEEIFIMATIDRKGEVWRRKSINSVVEMEDPVNRADILFNTTSSSLELAIVSAGDPYFFHHLTNAVSKNQNKLLDVTLEIRSIIGGTWKEDKIQSAPDSMFSQIIKEDDYNNEDAKDQWNSQVPLAIQAITQYTNCEPGTYDQKIFSCTLRDVKEGDLLNLCEHAFSSRPGGSIMHNYDDIVGDGFVCSGKWRTGTAVISWDGRNQVDFNVWSEISKEEIYAFQYDALQKLPTLVQKLSDVFPRGYGRVVNFRQDSLDDDDSSTCPSNR